MEYRSFNKILFVSIIIAMFSLGFISAYAIMLIDNTVEMPFSFSTSNVESAPSNAIEEKDIRVYEDRIVISIDNAKISRYAPTGSMIPILDEHANGIKIVPADENEINVGDIITFRQGTDLIVHRVVQKGVDDQGIYFITKGDNNSVVDGKVRFDMIDSKTIGILY
jgi:hypothetical protein